MIEKLPPERDEGSIEYKLKLTGINRERIEELASQMKYRLAEGGGEAFYVIGVTDDGLVKGVSRKVLNESLKTLEEVASIIGAKIVVVRRRKIGERYVAEVLVRCSREDKPPIFITVTALGNVDAGKSTLISVLCTGELDDGEGSAMRRIARFLHEIESGRTSSISEKHLGFSLDSEPVNYSLVSPLNEAEIYLKSIKVISLVDLGGHERYLRTTLKGVMSRHPDYAMIVVGANAGLLRMGREHLGICIALRIPVFIVVTKIDMTPKHVIEKTINEIYRILKLPGIDKVPFMVKDKNDAVLAARHIASGRIVPVFKVSSVTGEGIKLLLSFLNYLPPKRSWKEEVKNPAKLYVEDIFNVKGVGPVVAGLLLGGSIVEDDNLLIGPFKDGSWRNVRVRSIQVNRIPVHRIYAGQYATLALANIHYDEIEKGQVLLDRSVKPMSVKKFIAKVTILRHPTTIKRGYQAVFHMHSIRSTVSFVEMEKEPMRTGDTGRVVLEFMYHPWYIREGEIFMLRESRTKAIGRILEILE